MKEDVFENGSEPRKQHYIISVDSSELFMKVEWSETSRESSNLTWGFWKA